MFILLVEYGLVHRGDCINCETCYFCFDLLVEYGLVHRGDCINCETCYFCFDPAFVRPSLGHADLHSA